MSKDPNEFTVSVARAWLHEALRQLAGVRTHVDALNVFPVPDADTGTNVVLTVSSGARAAQELPAHATLADFTAAIAHGALWGARGNSGIIISQVLQAFADICADRDALGATELIQVCDAAAIAARDAIPHPVDGTIITVCQDVADATVRLPLNASITDVVGCALTAAHESLKRTGELLRAHTGAHAAFDAGAACYVVVLDALATVLHLPDIPTIDWPGEHEWCECVNEPVGGGEFEVMFVHQASKREAMRMRQRLTDLGDSVAVVAGRNHHWHVHVHLDQPARALPSTGVSQQVIVRHLHPETTRYGLVATTTAAGLLEDLARSGAITTLAPSQSALVRAIIDTGATDVTVLPASLALAQLAHRAKADPLLRAEGIEVHIAPTDCDPLVFAACAQWALAQLMESDAHPYPVAADMADTMRVIDLHASARSAKHPLPRKMVAEVALSEEPVTVFVGASASAPTVARQIDQQLQAHGVEVHHVAAEQRRPAGDLGPGCWGIPGWGHPGGRRRGWWRRWLGHLGWRGWFCVPGQWQQQWLGRRERGQRRPPGHDRRREARLGRAETGRQPRWRRGRPLHTPRAREPAHLRGLAHGRRHGIHLDGQPLGRGGAREQALRVEQREGDDPPARR
ncbi:MAG: DAK2 domain-containing protein, partial [Bowdeniella nasicola]|nr:DAK2 domain-containing protein [Bowdeniella nasicola]